MNTVTTVAYTAAAYTVTTVAYLSQSNEQQQLAFQNSCHVLISKMGLIT